MAVCQQSNVSAFKYAVYVCHSFSSKEQVSFNFMVEVMKFRHLLLGRKAMTNLDSMLKSRDITFQTKVCLVKL